jgi:arginyl-tRNA--protein-N-Asp/Glu arginylyltransferase
MSDLNDWPFASLQFYSTAPYQCSYLNERLARSQVATPNSAINADIYSDLVKNGFRRSGAFTYRPICDSCNECIPIRIRVKEFKKNRTHRRTMMKNRDLIPTIIDLQYSSDHYELYLKYQSARHAGGGMDQDSREQYRHFLLQSNVRTQLIEFKKDDKLAIVSIVDSLSEGLSSVYTFFDPSEPTLSLGTYSILWQIEYCIRLGIPYLYLGYWIKNSRKMSYKTGFAPVEGLISGRWVQLDGRGSPV